ncbi:MAG: nitrilase-related carbon-nitrogen hydrolase, partial [candidate division WOR-3 bacterium]
MRIGFFQFEPARHNKEANLTRINAALTQAEADLLVLPELCTTGYLFSGRAELAALAEPVPDGPTCQNMVRLARKRQLTIVWGMPESANGLVYNAAVMATPNGDVHHYRKAHLFLDEKDLFEPGNLGFPVFPIKDVPVGMLVCFDHFYPEAARLLALAGALVVCHPSNLVLDSAQKTTVARAIENRIFWVLANRVGAEEQGNRRLVFTGRSQVVAPDGTVLV